MDILNIKELEGWEDINFTKISTLRNKDALLLDELIVLLETLEKIRENENSSANHKSNKSKYSGLIESPSSLVTDTYSVETDNESERLNEFPVKKDIFITEKEEQRSGINEENWRMLTPRVYKRKCLELGNPNVRRNEENGRKSIIN